MKRFHAILSVWALLASVAVVWNPPDLSAAENDGNSSCIACHTNVKKLIKLCWKIEALRPKPLKSSETSGEG